MANTKEVRKQIASIKSTQKITSAMEMVAASKIKKTQNEMQLGRPYSEKIKEVISHIANSSSEYSHPFYEHRETKRACFLVVSSDKGLCGGLNINLFKQVISKSAELNAQGIESNFALIGLKAASFFKSVGGDVVANVQKLGDKPDPDADADLGEHSFTYSFYPHQNDLIRSNVIQESTILNHPPLLFNGLKNDTSESPINFDGKGIEITAIKKSEKDKELILRAVETLGKTCEGEIYFNGKVVETNLMERRNLKPAKNVNGSFVIKLKPFEIKTFRCSL